MCYACSLTEITSNIGHNMKYAFSKIAIKHFYLFIQQMKMKNLEEVISLIFYHVIYHSFMRIVSKKGPV